jgi:ApaG protein
MIESFFNYAQETRGFTVRVAVNYMPEQSEPGRERWFWAYHIRIENGSGLTAQLITRHWEISDARGMIQMVDGEGVVGDQPVIKPGGAYDYVSGCPLSTTHGSMVGSYQMIGEDGSRFEIAIPHFDLAALVVNM